MSTAGDPGAVLDLLGRHGCTLGPFVTTWKDENGVPVNLTGMTLENWINDGTTNLGELDVQVVDAVGGVFSFGLSATESGNLPVARSLTYYLVAVNGAVRTPLLAGKLNLR